MSITVRRTQHGRVLLLVSLVILVAFVVGVVALIRRQHPSAPVPPLHKQTSLIVPGSQPDVSFRTAV